ncbi:MAG: hypothetical protein KAX30_04775 [Candidatus Atribacteria bacterium]|nr:hypothetical protein [Candidatus Atribacteria bacterium]
MGRVTPRVRTELGIKLWTTATIYVANEVMQVLTTILDQRRLNLSALLSRKETLSDGLFTWITTRHLKTAVLEICHPNNSNTALERWDLIFK